MHSRTIPTVYQVWGVFLRSKKFAHEKIFHSIHRFIHTHT